MKKPLNADEKKGWEGRDLGFQEVRDLGLQEAGADMTGGLQKAEEEADVSVRERREIKSKGSRKAWRRIEKAVPWRVTPVVFHRVQQGNCAEKCKISGFYLS